MFNEIDNVVLVDIDDVLWDLLTPWVSIINKNNNLCVPVTDCKGWDMDKLFPTLTKEQIYDPLNEEEFWKNVEPRKGAVEYLRKLIDTGYDVKLCTTTSYKGYKPKVQRLRELFPFFNYHNIISCYTKQLVMGLVLVDDYIENLKGGTYNKILFTAQHNLLIPDSELKKENIVRVNNWEECYNEINNIYRQRVSLN